MLNDRHEISLEKHSMRLRFQPGDSMVNGGKDLYLPAILFLRRDAVSEPHKKSNLSFWNNTRLVVVGVGVGASTIDDFSLPRLSTSAFI